LGIIKYNIKETGQCRFMMTKATIACQRKYFHGGTYLHEVYGWESPWGIKYIKLRPMHNATAADATFRSQAGHEEGSISR